MTSAPRKILLLTADLQLRDSSLYTLHLAKGLEAAGHRAVVLCSSGADMPESLTRGVRLLTRPGFDRPYWGTFARRSLIRELRVDPPDLIHIQNRFALRNGLRLAHALQCPVVATLHQPLPLRLKQDTIAAQLKAVIAISRSICDQLREYGDVPRDRIHTIHLGIQLPDGNTEQESAKPTVEQTAALSALKPTARSTDTSKRHPVIGVVCPLETEKGVSFFIHAARVLINQQVDAQFVVAGSGPEEHRLRELVKELRIGKHVTFVPGQTDLGICVAALDIFCLTALVPRSRTIVLEAMAHGKPVIATQLAGIDELIVDNETGLLVPPSDAASLAKKIRQLLEDANLAQQIARNAHELLRKSFRLDQMVEETIAVYEEVIEPKKSGRKKTSSR